VNKHGIAAVSVEGERREEGEVGNGGRYGKLLSGG